MSEDRKQVNEADLDWLRERDQPLNDALAESVSGEPPQPAGDDLLRAAEQAEQAVDLAERWLANCVPVVELQVPKPLPIIRQAQKALRSAIAEERKRRGL